MNTEPQTPAPRDAPIISGVIHFAIVAGLVFLWHPRPGSIWWYVRDAIATFFVMFGAYSIWLGFFGSGDRVRREVDGDPPNSN